MKVNPAREAELVDSAESDSEATLLERCQRAKAEGRSKEAEARHFQKLHEDRKCRTWTDDDGAFRLQAVLAPEVGAGMLAALEAQTDRQFAQARSDGRFETTDAYRADALVALVTGRGILGPKGNGSGAPSGRRPADPRATVSVVVDLEALRRGSVGEGSAVRSPGWARWASNCPRPAGRGPGGAAHRQGHRRHHRLFGRTPSPNAGPIGPPPPGPEVCGAPL